MVQSLDHAQAMRLLQTLPLGIIATGQERIIWINEQAEQMAGLNAKALCGKSINALPSWLKLIFTGQQPFGFTGESNSVLSARLEELNAGEIQKVCFLSDVSELGKLNEDLQSMEKRLDILVTRDDSCGLLNKRGLLQLLESQVSRSRRYGNALSLISMHINDYGIDNESTVLVALGYLFNDRLRWADSVGRVEENEFILVLPETDGGAAVALVDKLKNELKTLPLNNETVSVSASFGVAAWCEGDDPSRLLLRCQADRQVPLAVNQ